MGFRLWRSLCLLALIGLGAVIPALHVRAQAAEFDYYVLSLSWSPSWCEANDRGGRTAQCNSRHRYGFIAHGLWPQRARGWLQDCHSNEPDRVPEALARSYFDIIPSAGLAGHEWRKHGTCTGLSQNDYFRTLRAAYSKVLVPPVVFNGALDRKLGTDQIEALFMRVNAGLTRDAIAVSCDDGRLSEIRICMSKSLGYVGCPEVDRRSCRLKTITLPAIK
jgi:ribonuclease T2